MEGQLNQDDSVLKVAVKTMKSKCPAGAWGSGESLPPRTPLLLHP